MLGKSPFFSHLLSATGLALVFATGATAHHSRLEFAAEGFEIDGELVTITWANPHPDLTVKVVNEQGEEDLWYLQVFGSLYTLTRGGVSGDLFEPGQRLRLALRPSMRREKIYLVSHVLLADGTEVILNRVAEPRWSARHIGGAREWADESQVVDAAGENRGIFRVWSPQFIAPRSDGGLRGDVPRVQLQESALANRDEFDPFASWNTRCESPGMPIVMTGPSAFEFIDDDATIRVRGGHYEFVRTIHMTDAQDPATQAASPLGYSIGRWEGDTLVVETSRINWPYFDFRGTPQSEAVQTLERLTLSEDQTRLAYHMTITDPETFVEASSMNLAWLALGEVITPIENECDNVRGI